MRASRLLRMLLLLQNRGRMTSVQLAEHLEVTPRTIMRDVDALSAAGLPVIVHRGSRGGIELGFRYRTRLTPLDTDELEALAVLFAAPGGAVDELGLRAAAEHACRKLEESLPDPVRKRISAARAPYRLQPAVPPPPDPRLAALASAVRGRRIVRINADTPVEQVIHPIALSFRAEGWAVVHADAPDTPIALRDCGRVNLSARTFDA